MKGADLLVKCLEEECVSHIFGLPGEENMDMLEALVHSKMKFICTRHEQGAAFMADMYGRLTGKAGVCLATLGPGATNLMTGVADANMDRAPLVAITGQGGLDRMHKESHQYLDVVGTMKHVTKWAQGIRSLDTIPEIVRKAFKLAEEEKPGATHIELPEDLGAMETSFSPITTDHTYQRSIPSEESLEKAAKLISRAKHPIVLAGNGVIRGKASEELRTFAKNLSIPVANTFMGKGVLRSDDPLSLCTIGMQAKDWVLCGFDRADVIIAIGFDMVEYSPKFWNELKKPVIHIDFTRAEIDSHYPVIAEVVGNISLSITRLTEMCRRHDPANLGYALRLKKMIHEEITQAHADDSFPMNPQRALIDIRKALGEDDILISDVGAHKIWAARTYLSDKPNTCIISNGFATMGIAVPGAIGAKLVFPKKNIVALTGDGGFMMNSQELETAIRYKTPFVCVIFNDGGYGLIHWKMVRKFGNSHFTGFSNPDFVQYAKSFGARGHRVEKADEFLPLLKKSLKSDVPVVIDVPIDYAENFKLSDKLTKISCNL